ncbi:MAG: lipid-A-disaccharide synthase [Caldithrix sp.]|nr:lipid-A-disaccharide synthase [Caldithrix sp.]
MHEILLVAGEVSGDDHGAAVLKHLTAMDDELHAFGIGGEALANQGMELMYHLRDLAFLGIGEIIRHLPFIFEVQRRLLQACSERQPRAAILIDYPGFNLRLAKRLHQLDIKVIYYISPQLWAWGRRRVHKIKRYVHKMLVLFPFEKKFYQQYGIDVKYVGHPLVDKYHHLVNAGQEPLTGETKRIGILPGSRKQEVSALLPKMLQTARQLHQEGLIREAIIVRVHHLEEAFYHDFLNANDDFVRIRQVPLQDILPQLHAALVASGTATLETGYFQVPMVIVYHVNPLTYWIGRLLVKVRFIGLVNIVAEKEVAPELIQSDFKPAKAAQLLQTMISDEHHRYRQSLATIREKLGAPGAAQRAAQTILNELNGT